LIDTCHELTCGTTAADAELHLTGIDRYGANLAGDGARVATGARAWREHEGSGAARAVAPRSGKCADADRGVNMNARCHQWQVNLIEQRRLIPTATQRTQLAAVLGIAPSELLREVQPQLQEAAS
jgi:hypothetical protein